jgi:hypothetical protein
MDSGSIEKDVLKQQNKLCEKYGVEFVPSSLNNIVGVALHTFELQQNPINGLRQPTDIHSNVGWYIWAGEYSSANDFFKPVHMDHLLAICPQILNYLGLAPGWRFLFDDKGYEDVWYDKELLSIII